MHFIVKQIRYREKISPINLKTFCLKYYEVLFKVNQLRNPFYLKTNILGIICITLP